MKTVRQGYPTFQEFVARLMRYWTDHGCIMSQPYDSMMGAGTFHPHTFLKGIGPEPWRAVYVQPCRRPVDGRYGKSPYRFQHYYQLQVLLKPSPANIVDLFLKSLEEVGIALKENDISLLEDDWKGPTLGAWGLGWEVRANGQEITQFTYFQQLGGIDIEVVSGEITYGLERLYMYATGIKNGFDIPFNEHFTYGDVFLQNEFEFSHFNFKEADTRDLFERFAFCEQQIAHLCAKNLVLPAYDYVLQASHAFNLLDARGAISVSERQRYIGRVRDCARQCALIYRGEREKAGFPMLDRLERDARQEWQRNGPAQLPEFRVSEGEVYRPGNTQGTLDVAIEFGCEELPPSFQVKAQKELSQKWASFVSDLKVTHAHQPDFIRILDSSEVDVVVGSRRLGLFVRNLPVNEPSRAQDLWGPVERIARSADGSLSPAGLGFCRKNGVDPESVTFVKKADGTFLYAKKVIAGSDLPTRVARVFEEWVCALSAPLMMRWLPQEVSPAFVRPVRWILALAGDRILPLEAFGLKSGRATFGQRILFPGKVEIENASAWIGRLRSLGVEPSWGARAQWIRDQVLQQVKVHEAAYEIDEDLLAKCAGISESPFVFCGKIDAEFLKLPARLIKTVLKENMNFFALQDESGKALPVYVGVAGYKPGDIQGMIDGTQGVVAGRLSDGTFYFDGDLATPIQELREKLKNQLFQEGMGSLFDKTVRVADLVSILAEKVSYFSGTQYRSMSAEEREVAVQAALYSKADLRSGCVQEFPDEMQGLMGGVLVRHQQLGGVRGEEMARAIEDHYEPVGASGKLPGTSSGQLVSLADKLDTLALFVNSGFDIKGNKDPFGLRRSAIAILRLMGLESTDLHGLRLELQVGVRAAVDALRSSGAMVQADTEDKMMQFLMGRLRAAWREVYDPGAVEAVCAKLDSQSLIEGRLLAEATSAALKETGSLSLLHALIPYRRCRNLTQDISPEVIAKLSVDPALFQNDSEKVLFQSILGLEVEVERYLGVRDYRAYLSALTQLTLPLADFFEKVMVNTEEARLRMNRQALLLRVRAIYERIADFSKVQVPGLN